MLGFMAVSGIFGLRNLQRLSISIKFPEEVYANTRTHATAVISSRSRFLPGCLLTLHLHSATTMLPLLKAGETVQIPLPLLFSKRGQVTIRKIFISSPFPVNFFDRSIAFALDETCLVFPELKPLSFPVQRGMTEGERGNRSKQGGSGGETESISIYTGTEPLRQIHWKLSARHEELLVRHSSAERGEPLIIDPLELHGEREQQLSHAAYLVNRLIREERAVGLSLGDITIVPACSKEQRLKLLTELALHDQN